MESLYQIALEAIDELEDFIEDEYSGTSHYDERMRVVLELRQKLKAHL